MATVERTKQLAAEPARGWDVLADFGAIATWAPNVDHSCLMSEQEPDVGTTRRVQTGRTTLLETVSFVLRILAVPAQDRKRRAFQALRAVGLHHKMHAYPLQLSGGEQQRVAIARALINEPELLLADEPTGDLDPDRAQEIMGLFQEVNARGTTVLVATHDPEMIERMGKRVITLDGGRLISE